MNGINYEMMIEEIQKELSTVRKTSGVTSEQVPSWENRVEA